MSRKKKPTTPSWSTGDKSKGFIRIHRDMIFSRAFKSLTKNQKLLYIYMVNEYNPSTKVSHPDNNPNCFWFNRRIYKEKDELYSNDSQFYRDRDELIKKGFIEQVSSGYTTREKTVYKFSDRWKRYDENSPFELKPNERTASMMKKGRHSEKE